MPIPLLAAGAVTAASAIGNHFLRKGENKDAMGMQLEANKEMAALSKANQLDIWNRTNSEAQVKHLKAAGLNPALLYGGSSGTGGATTGSGGTGSAGLPSAGNYDIASNIAQLANLTAQNKLIEAQTEKTQTETNKIAGADTDKITEETRGTRFQNDLNDLITKEKMLDKYTAESDIKEIEATRANGEWEAYKAAGWKGKTFDDPNSPIAKALNAGWDKAIVDLENAKKDGDIKKAETVVKQFEANMAAKGLDPKAPWYTKFIADLLEKVGVKLF